MIKYIKNKPTMDGNYLIHAVCKSSDIKPTINVAVGSHIFEIDTGKDWVWNANKWICQDSDHVITEQLNENYYTKSQMLDIDFGPF